MVSLMAVAIVASAVSVAMTWLAIRTLAWLGVHQPIREMGITTHERKRGTPTMGGCALIASTIVTYLAEHVAATVSGAGSSDLEPLSTTAVLLLCLFLFMGVVGFIDDLLKVRHKNSAGLSLPGKLAGQLLVGGAFGILAAYGRRPPAGEYVSFMGDIGRLHLDRIATALVFTVVILATANAVNLTDGLDGLAAGASAMVLGSYGVIALWQSRQSCEASTRFVLMCNGAGNTQDIGVIAIAAAGACVGFLWWNASPARIFMGDTGALGLGALMGGLSVATHTVLLLPILSALFVIVTLSVIVQFIVHKTTGRWVLRMAPLHHHFELAGWSEVRIVSWFWVAAALGVAAGIGAFYAGMHWSVA